MIRIDNLHVRYATERGTVHAVNGVDLEVGAAQFYTLLGPSGCGKTTTLRCLAGLETPSEGRITIGDQTVFSSADGTFVPPWRRDIGMVFQSYAIWPHMTVFENVAFPLREMRPRRGRMEIRERVTQALALVQLQGYEDRPAPFLSGGQQQRLALARALVKEPKVLLLDEPLSNLDAKLREETRIELRELVVRLGITTVYVTHDQLEALTMSDVVAVMDQGKIVQTASPADIYQRPNSRFVASFIGQTNFIHATVSERGAGGDAVGVAHTASGPLRCVLPDRVQPGDAVVVAMRLEDIRPWAPGHDAENTLEGEVEAIVYMGESLECVVSLGEDRVRLRLHPSATVRRGESIRVAIDGRACRALVG